METIRVPPVGVVDDARRAMPDHQVSGVAVVPESSGQFLILEIEHQHAQWDGRPSFGTAEFALSPRAAAILCREIRKALRECLIGLDEKTE